ncbi:MAG: peptide chain release factor N(5)-glutamine methyltransferase [Stomatobaculum sp.]|nr:peptide chain release factor N(5)-glutamine methyltransferase [Stomatobaculum sp.]
MTFRELLMEGRRRLEAAGVEEAENDARLLLLDTYRIDWCSLVSVYEMRVPVNPPTPPVSACKVIPRRIDHETEAGGAYLSVIDRRAARVPLQYLTHEQNFCGSDLYVDERVLIPRQDTEVLVAAALDVAAMLDGFPALLDLCTGSGCIPIALSRLGDFGSITASDLSAEALEVAKINAEQNGAQIRFVQSDLFDAFKKKSASGESIPEPAERFDLITCNPPYIRRGDLAGLQPEVRDYEPAMALDGGEDGLDFYRRLAAEAGQFLNPGGGICFEIGFDQAADVAALLEKAGFQDIQVRKDLAGLDRVVTAYV